MGHLGFSYVGCIFLMLLFIPNLIWGFKKKPKEYTAQNENKTLLLFERSGQILTACSALIFADFNPSGLTAWSWWLAGSCLLMAIYELWWIRYFKSAGTLSDFYGTFCGIPVPGAVLPVAAFLLLGIYGKVIWLILSAVILGIGHIGIHLQHRAELLSGK